MKILIGLAKGLEAIHKKDYVHRDIKPQNIMIGADGQVKVGDLGLLSAIRRVENKFQTLSSVLSARAALPGAGTVFYMPPEAIEQKWKRSADVWAVAGVAVFCITKETPYLYEYQHGGFVVDLIRQGKLPNALRRVRSTFPEIEELLLKMFSLNSRSRPKISSVKEQLAALYQSLV